MPARHYSVNEIFGSLQGEGLRAGTANVFIRMAGCNLACDVEPGPLSPGGFACDTEFVSSRKLTADEIVAEALAATGGSGDGWGVIFTGGEPGLQLDAGLVAAFGDAEFFTAIETNGTIDVSGLGLDWVTVSPKVAEHAVKQLVADEVKYVRHYGQGIPKPRCVGRYKLISPGFGASGLDPRDLAWCIDLVKKNPDWRLSVQQHKAWGVR